MPCRDDRDEPGWQRGYDSGSHGLKTISAMLCAALTVLEKNKLMGQIDYNEAGVGKSQLTGWWERHKREDAMRREREKQAAVIRNKKLAALAKLTPAERKVLGL